MALYEYSTKPADAAARAQAYDLDASYKDLSQVCAAIKRRLVPDARQVLEDCISLERAIRYTKFNKHLGHRSELGGKKGRYPRKEARIMLDVLENAAASATHKGLKPEELVVSHAAAYQQNEISRYRHHWAGSVTLGYGKQNLYANYATARVELILAPAPKEVLERREKRKVGYPGVKPKVQTPAPALKSAPATKPAEQVEEKK